MKPHRLTLTNCLVLGYGLDKKFDYLISPRPATREELEEYHDARYINILEQKSRSGRLDSTDDSPAARRGHLRNSASILATNDNHLYAFEPEIFTEDCPVFGGMFDFFKQYAGGSLSGARSLANKSSDIAINWSGGLHHAKKAEPSGFCYINDIVLAILELLR